MNKVVAATIISVILLIVFTGGKSYDMPLPDKLHITNLMPPNESVDYYINKYSKIYRIPTKLVLRSAKLESSYKGKNHEDYRPYANNLVSSAQAYGPLQVRVVAARDVWPELSHMNDNELAHKLRYDLDFNIHTAIKYMRKLIDEYKCNTYDKLFTAYNRGMKYKDSTNSYAKEITKNI